MFRVDQAHLKAPPVVPTQFPPIEPVALAQPIAPAPPYASAYPPPYEQYYAPTAYRAPVRPVMVPVYYAAPMSAPARRSISEAAAPLRPLFDPSDSGDWPLPRLAAISTPARSSVVVVQQSMPAPPIPPLDPRRVDRLQLTSWAYLRSQQTGIAGSRSLATGGQLGASQAGARLIYNFHRQLALAARFSSEVGRRGGEAAAGVRVQPLSGIPVWITGERRQALGRYGGGRDAFALFAEGGLYERPLPWRFRFDSYFQGGVVGMRGRDWFVDGGLWVSRPVYRNFSAGFGVWGAAQPGLHRVDAGPRLTMRVRRNIKAHFDWRQRLIGNARPGSGAALTLAADF